MAVDMNPSTSRSVYLVVTYARRAAPALVAALTLLAGCGGAQPPAQHQAQHGANHGSSSSATNPPSKPAKVMTVQQLAVALGCEASVTTGKDFRQATCTSPTDRYVLVDFDTAASQRAWLEGGHMYGGIYLTGDRWALTGKPKEYLQTLQATLGGTIEGDGSH
jgi:hypothetical protein